MTNEELLREALEKIATICRVAEERTAFCPVEDEVLKIADKGLAATASGAKESGEKCVFVLNQGAEGIPTEYCEGFKKDHRPGAIDDHEFLPNAKVASAPAPSGKVWGPEDDEKHLNGRPWLNVPLETICKCGHTAIKHFASIPPHECMARENDKICPCTGFVAADQAEKEKK